MKTHLLLLGKILICYCIAGVVLLAYLAWPNLESNAHVPFSGFQGFLVFSPVAPLLLFKEENQEVIIMGGTLFLLVFLALLFLVFWLPKQIRRT